MSATGELKRLLAAARVTPYRRVGKVRAIYDPATPGETLAAALAAVRAFAPAMVDEWGEPSGNWVSEQRRAGAAVAEVCDDPVPAGIDPAACPVAWLAERSARYHFRVVADGAGGIAFSPEGDWNMRAVVPLLPAWYVAACRERRPEIVAHVLATAQASPAAHEPQTCRVCGRDVSDPEDRERLDDPLFCSAGGGREVRDRQGAVLYPAGERCPFKKN